MASRIQQSAPPQPLSFRRSKGPTPSPSPMLRGHSQLDEGFSEETRSLADSDMMYPGELDANAQQVLDMVLNLPPEQHVVDALVRSLPNRDKEVIGSLCETLTHFDPAHYLPNELMFSVLSYLSPKDLLTASVVSRPWRDRARDEKLWRGCFAREGWILDPAKMKEYEELAKRKGMKAAQAMAGQPVGSDLDRRGSRKRKTEEAFSEGETALAGSSASASSAGRSAVTDTSMNANASDDGSDDMEGVELSTDLDSRRASTGSVTSAHPSDILPPNPSDIKIAPTMWRPGSLDAVEPRLSWPWLYKQRCRLEKNWENAEYAMFSLPHIRHQGEGHTECVYTIQHTSKHMVSGSRDKTIRKWDLETYRLIGAPLKGHDASVLCLQFDERPEHDIIVSGGSDNYLIIWRFSTGQIIKKHTHAHSESVLNLRFDDRYIVTCSKDKTIKIWNRRALATDDPLIPSHQLLNIDNPGHYLRDVDLVKEYTLLAILTGHQAAVNAVMIHDNTIISASGDRTIKSWNIDLGRLEKTYLGHTKGIACVQFDGRRIVSGSSDNTVRIFDAEQQAEIACLTGHGNLVRTVQARFGDLDTVTAAELEDEARKADRNFYKALEAGMQPASAARRGNVRNAGSSRPEDMLSLGTKVPPGGGGSRWAKIVSGSYDETVILWKRDREGRWAVRQTMHQDMLLKSSEWGGSARRTPATALPQPANVHQNAVQPQQIGLGGLQGMNATQQAQHAAQQAHANAVLAASAAQPTMLMAGGALQLQQTAGMGNAQGLLPSAAAAAAAGNAAPANHLAPPHTAGHAPLPAGPAGLAPPAAAPTHHHHHHHPAHAHAHAHAQAQAHAHAHAAAAAAQQQAHRDSNRVFKLQFDARRIVCCSQNKVIVGWDFAKGDKGLERVGSWSVETA
ncbi:hypothetical protein LTR36_006005 [Oleoguttula mirabilis]|uniref:F-box domain-containing protein n=1 Tax=Oleoguttula mirabilis TaxID=1507867 RepID=A0AAV9JCX7_9PEZI|nr:hypothetical protein LTR36_006005 [Oleoguttula mirabilis]